ncbi:MAG: hypothetical protein DME76_00405 [Verrucomicrobia bacterium]|nr:MAG: hypothetical protein DME76_00405 [Verrucomicrobiota bacterium]
MSPSEPPRLRMDELQQRSLLIGGLALAVCAAGWFFSPQQFFRSYLVAYLFWIGIPLGCFAIVMLHHLVGGGWGFVIQRLLEAGIRTFPLMVLLFIPVLFGVRDLYVWARPDEVTTEAFLRQKDLYLNVPFFVTRTIIYFAVWISVGYFLNRWSLEQDRIAEGGLTQRLQSLSGPGLVLYGLTVTFASIDWIMSLEPRWYSTIYGMIFMVSFVLAAFAFVIAVAFFLSGLEPLSNAVSPDRFQDLGNLLLAFVMFWAYMAFSQFLLVWVENLAQEIPWYLHRTTGSWEWVALSLILFQFSLPFVLLLSRATKRRAGILSIVAIGILFMHWVDLFWMVTPAFYPSRFHFHWMDIIAPIGVGGIWIGVFLGQLKERSLLPLHDPRFSQTQEQGA